MLHLLPHLLEVGHGEAHGDRGDDVVVLGKEDSLLDAPVINAAVGIHLAHAGVLPQPQGELQDIGHAVGLDNHHKIAQLHGVIDVAAAAVLLGVLQQVVLQRRMEGRDVGAGRVVDAGRSHAPSVAPPKLLVLPVLVRQHVQGVVVAFPAVAGGDGPVILVDGLENAVPIYTQPICIHSVKVAQRNPRPPAAFGERRPLRKAVLVH